MSEQRMQALVTEVPVEGSPVMVKKLIPVPELAPNQALVKISYIAQNPTDGMLSDISITLRVKNLHVLTMAIVQSLDSNAFGNDAVLGCDYVGTVEKTGDKCSKLSRGDTVAGLIWGGALLSVIRRYDANLTGLKAKSRASARTASTLSRTIT